MKKYIIALLLLTAALSQAQTFVPAGDTLLISGNITDTFIVEGVLKADPTKDLFLNTNKACFIVQGNGLWLDSGAANNITHTYQISNIDESTFYDAPMMPDDNIPGFFIIDSGRLNIQGADKTSWTHLQSGVKAGATFIKVDNRKGWHVADEIFIAAVGKPVNDWNYNSTTHELTDPFNLQFERRIITKAKRRKLYFTEPLQYDHLAVRSDSLKVAWHAEVGNLTRNIKIQGTPTGRSHIFVMSGKPQILKNVEVSQMGPRRVATGDGRTNLYTGIYSWHQHMNGDGSRGTIVFNNAFHDEYTRGVVPHSSNGITIDSNVLFNLTNEGIWYDDHSPTHDLTVTHNLIADIRFNGFNSAMNGIIIKQGDNNRYDSNTFARAGYGDAHSAAAANWPANEEATVEFNGNTIHSVFNGAGFWQNTERQHLLLDNDFYDDSLAVGIGAYGTATVMKGGHVYNAQILETGTAFNSEVGLFDVAIDAGKYLKYPVQVTTSPFGSNWPNKIVNCKIFYPKGGAAVQIFDDCYSFNHGPKHVELINNYYSDNNHDTIVPCAANKGSIVTENTTNQVWNNGNGLLATYYKDASFSDVAFKRIDSKLFYGQWAIDSNSAPNGADYRLTNYPVMSSIYEGYIKPQVTGTTTFYIQGAGGARVTLGGQVIANFLTEEKATTDTVKCLPVFLDTANYYPIKVEYVNREVHNNLFLYWQVPAIKGFDKLPDYGREVVPMSQLFTAVPQQSIAKNAVLKKLSTSDNISVYPQPSNGMVIVTSPAGTTLKITDVTRRIIAPVQTSTGTNRFNIPVAGVYILNNTHKIIILK